VDELEDPHPNPHEAVEEKQEAQRLYRAVEELDEHLRQAVYLHYYQDLSLRETAYILNVAVSTVKYRLRRAIELLKPILSN
jgi:RNA polymerase sigma-70 factor (ECF subfamily)